MNATIKRMKTFMECNTFLEGHARRSRNNRMEQQYAQWVENGSVLPMPHLGKRKVILEYAARYKQDVFIETGTYTGHMVYGVVNEFREIYSIELGLNFAERAKMRFRGYRHVHILQGDSGQVLPEILKTISEPCRFWLDAHYSSGATARGDLDTPIVQECVVYSAARAVNRMFCSSMTHVPIPARVITPIWNRLRSLFWTFGPIGFLR